MSALTRYVRDNVLGFLAIFIALSAGAYAIDVAPRNSVVSKSVRNGAIKRVDLARNSVDGSKVINGSLTGADIDEASLAIEGDGNSGGTVTSITAGAGLDGGAITNQGTIALHQCPASQLLKSTGDGYGCAEDSDTATTYTADAARGIELDGTTFGLKACPDGQLLKSAGAGAYGCAADIDTDTQYAGNLAKGIELDGTSFGLKPCAAGLLLKSAGAGAYNCAGDIDTNTTYSAGTGLQLSGTQFSIASGGVGGAQVADGSLSAADLGFVRAVNFSASALANGQCASAIQSQTAQFAPGQEGDFTLMSSSPAVPLNFVLAGRVGPINGGFRDYYFSVCNLTGSTANMPATTVRMLVIAQ
jgi:hypothetical protein